MSKFLEFYNKINGDPVVTEEFKKIAEKYKLPAGVKISDLSNEVLTALIPVAEKAGFEFTVEEVKAYLKKSDEGELSDDELEAVAGGKNEVYETHNHYTIVCEAIGATTVNQ